jgi:hypothetical protein
MDDARFRAHHEVVAPFQQPGTEIHVFVVHVKLFVEPSDLREDAGI